MGRGDHFRPGRCDHRTNLPLCTVPDSLGLDDPYDSNR